MSNRTKVKSLVLASATLALSLSSAGFAQSASLQQCANGSLSSPRPCTGKAWVTGNLGQKNSHYFEGDAVPFRLVLDKLTPGGSNVVGLQWDTTEGGMHAYDYLTSYDATESAGNDPCSGLSGCGGFTTFPVPVDPNVSGAGVTQVPGGFTLFGGGITSVSSYTLDGSYDGRSSTLIFVTFTPYQSRVALAWGAHLAAAGDWVDAASDIPGASYHVRLWSLDGKSGNQDRSISGVLTGEE